MEMEATSKGRTAHIGINKVSGAIQLTVPQGTKLVDALRALSKIDLSEIARLPRGCQNCISGHPFDIREQFDPVINVRLDQIGH